MPFNPDDFFVAAWGDIQFLCSSVTWRAGQTQVVHALSSGDSHPIQHRGSHHRVATVQILFDDFPGARLSGIALWRALEATTGQRRLFSHPVDGSYYARIGDLSPQLDEDTVLSVTAEFLPDDDVIPVRPAGAGTAGVAGAAAVAAGVDKAATALADKGMGFPKDKLDKMDFTRPIELNIDLSFKASVEVEASFSASVGASASASATAGASASASATASASASASAFAFASVFASATAVAQATAVAEVSAMASASAFAFAYAAAAVGADAKLSVQAWADLDTESGTVPVTRINNDVARISESIAALIEQGELEDHLELYPVFQSMVLMGESVRAAAVAARAETSSLFVMQIRQRRRALLPLMAQIYGGRNAVERARQVTELNDIRTPGWMEPGNYLMPSRRSDDLA